MKKIKNMKNLNHKNRNQRPIRFLAQNNNEGKNWHQEVGSISDKEQAIRTEFYNERAKLKDAVLQDVRNLETPEFKTVTAKGGYLFGILDRNFGEKTAFKILQILSNKKFNVDRMPRKTKVQVIQKDEISTFVAVYPDGTRKEVPLHDKPEPAPKPKEKEIPKEMPIIPTSTTKNETKIETKPKPEESPLQTIEIEEKIIPFEPEDIQTTETTTKIQSVESITTPEEKRLTQKYILLLDRSPSFDKKTMELVAELMDDLPKGKPIEIKSHGTFIHERYDDRHQKTGYELKKHIIEYFSHDPGNEYRAKREKKETKAHFQTLFQEIKDSVENNEQNKTIFFIIDNDGYVHIDDQNTTEDDKEYYYDEWTDEFQIENYHLKYVHDKNGLQNLLTYLTPEIGQKLKENNIKIKMIVQDSVIPFTNFLRMRIGESKYAQNSILDVFTFKNLRSLQRKQNQVDRLIGDNKKSPLRKKNRHLDR